MEDIDPDVSGKLSHDAFANAVDVFVKRYEEIVLNKKDTTGMEDDGYKSDDIGDLSMDFSSGSHND